MSSADLQHGGKETPHLRLPVPAPGTHVPQAFRRVLARLPRDFTDIFTDETAADAVAVRAELGRHQRALQAALILQRLQDAADRLVSWILPVRALRYSASTDILLWRSFI